MTDIFHGAASNGLPEAWHRPLFDDVRRGTTLPPRGAQNSDPWIFGEKMRYSNCRQQRSPLLRHLDAGDVIFFGSQKKRTRDGMATTRYNFFVDTIFVVGSEYPYRQASDLPQWVQGDALFSNAVLRRLATTWPHPFKLYVGATPGERIGGLFSWVPSRPFIEGNEEAVRFARPMVNDVLGLADTGNNGQLTYNLLDLPADEAWHRVVSHCRELGLLMATEVGDTDG